MAYIKLSLPVYGIMCTKSAFFLFGQVFALILMNTIVQKNQWKSVKSVAKKLMACQSSRQKRENRFLLMAWHCLCYVTFWCSTSASLGVAVIPPHMGALLAKMRFLHLRMEKSRRFPESRHFHSAANDFYVYNSILDFYIWWLWQLDGLTARKISSGEIILPIRHDVTRDDIE